MPRRRRSSDSSLDLLLDTITNTFGGILFLAILVVILLRSSSTSTTSPDDSSVPAVSSLEQAEMEVRFEDLNDRLTRAQAEIRARRDAIPSLDLSAVIEADELASTISQQLSELSRLQLQIAAAQRDAEHAAQEIADLASRASSAEERLGAARRERDLLSKELFRLAETRKRLAAELDADRIEQEVGLPQIHDTSKKFIGVYVRFGKLFVMHHWRRGIRSGPNTHQFIVVPGSPPTAFPRPGAGVPIMSTSVDQLVKTTFADFPPSAWVLDLVVFSDSFSEYQLLKRAIVARGYEYSPLAVAPGDSVMDSGGDAKVQ